MNQELFFGLLIGGMFLSSVTLGQLQVGGQNEKATDPTTGAEELATKAYLDNFEYVEPALEQKDARDLKEQIEGMMREDLRDMIRDNASIEEVGSHINATDAKLMEATSILNETRK
jgi:hypothetical protein